ncbi:MAG: hypothetical protein QOG00_608 [Pyrinomonadaceae bacterium]|jgi:hypothetical protein|nr:hypothetical protein [Pyrinomonadaceae bacterium]
MKKILLLVLVSALLLLLSGCKAAGLNSCTRAVTGAGQPLIPGARYLVIYQYLNPPLFRERIANSNGQVSVPSEGQPCTSLLVTPLTNSNQALSASPSSVYLPTPPSTATVTGQQFDTTYGMPRVDYYDGNGYLVGSAYATSVSGGGTALEASVPDLTNAYSGTYQVKVTNKTYEGYYSHIVGTATMSAWGRDRPDSDGDGWYDDEDCSPYDPYLNTDCSGSCGGASSYGPPYEVPTFCEY